MSLLDPTLTLPDELLAHIFGWSRRIDPIQKSDYYIPSHENDTRSAKTLAMGWIQVTFVCARWRRVAKEEALLWNELDFDVGPEWLDEFVTRSKGALLDIVSSHSQTHFNTRRTNIAQLIRNQHNRVRCVQLYTMDDYTLNVFNSVAQIELPFLETFSLHFSGFSKPYQLEKVMARLSISAPKLQRLHLNVLHIPFTAVDWRLGTFSMLHHLYLCFQGYLPIELLPPFLDALRCMPVISSLILTGESGRSEAPVSPTNAATVAYLPHLRELQLNRAFESNTHFLRHIRIPGSTYINIHNKFTCSLPDTESLLEHLSLCMEPHLSQQPPFLSATIKLCSGCTLDQDGMIVSHPDGIELSLRRPVDKGPVIWRAYGPQSTVRLNELRLTLAHDTVFALPPIISLREITTLTIDERSWMPDSWPVLSILENIKTLYFFCQFELPLYETGLSILASTDGKLLFPKLRHLQLIGYNLEKIAYDPRAATGDSTLIEDIIHERRAMRAPLCTVEFPIAGMIRRLEGGEWWSLEDGRDASRMSAIMARLRALPEIKIIEEYGSDIGLRVEC